MKTHRENRSLAEKQVDVKNAIIKASSGDNPAWLSTNQLARILGMARNGRFKAMLDWMVDCGTLVRRECERPGRWPGYEYSLSERTRNFYYKPRPIKINRRGKQVESMELWS